YSTRDIRSLVDALPKVLPVDLEHREDGSIRISSRYAQL
ncbi:peptide ABC transporter substrate-binding protein, partial [Pseudomonas aeruginosa]|nr:peptide ABC transporter substrate-binding protein [Pseudomonas aeruginosa]